MQAYRYLLLGPTPISLDGGGGGGRCRWIGPSSLGNSRRRRRFAAFATVSGRRNHYDVLGVPTNASSSDIKRAYRLLALKYHPDVNKEVGANEDFKNIRLAYDILRNELTRAEYDRSLHHHHHQPSSRGPLEYEYRDSRRQAHSENVFVWEWKWEWEEYDTTTSKDQSSFDKDARDEERGGSFAEVLKSSFISLFLMQTLGTTLSLTFSSITALTDSKLDAGYKLGYLFAWIHGGRAGILLTMFVTFASWICGKNNSGRVALVVFAMWFGSNLTRYFGPMPRGAVLAFLYMSMKLQVHLT